MTKKHYTKRENVQIQNDNGLVVNGLKKPGGMYLFEDKQAEYVNGNVIVSNASWNKMGTITYDNSNMKDEFQNRATTTVPNNQLTSIVAKGSATSNPISTADLLPSGDPFGDGSLRTKLLFDDDILDVTNNRTAQQNNITYQDGKFGKAAVFNGTDSYVVILNAFEDKSKLESESVSLFVKGSKGGIMDTQGASVPGNGGLSSMSFFMTTPGDLFFSYFDLHGSSSGGIIKELAMNVNLNDGKYHHLVVTTETWDVDYVGPPAKTEVQKQSLKIYIDGAFKQRVLITRHAESELSVMKNLFLGQQAQNNPQYLTGSIDQVEIYNRALTQDEVSILYNQNKFIGDVGLITDITAEYTLESISEGPTKDKLSTRTPIKDGDLMFLATDDGKVHDYTAKAVDDRTSALPVVNDFSDQDISKWTLAGSGTIRATFQPVGSYGTKNVMYVDTTNHNATTATAAITIQTEIGKPAIFKYGAYTNVRPAYRGKIELKENGVVLYRRADAGDTSITGEYYEDEFEWIPKFDKVDIIITNVWSGIFTLDYAYIQQGSMYMDTTTVTKGEVPTRCFLRPTTEFDVGLGFVEATPSESESSVAGLNLYLKDTYGSRGVDTRLIKPKVLFNHKGDKMTKMQFTIKGK